MTVVGFDPMDDVDDADDFEIVDPMWHRCPIPDPNPDFGYCRYPNVLLLFAQQQEI